MTAAQLVVESLEEHPEDWEDGHCMTVNHKTGVSLWTGNGFWFLHTTAPVELSFSIPEKFIVSKALRKWRTLKIMMAQTPDKEEL